MIFYNRHRSIFYRYKRIQEFEKMDEAIEFMNEKMDKLKNRQKVSFFTKSYTIMME